MVDEQWKLAGEVLQSYWNINRETVKLSQQNAASLGITLQQIGVLNTLVAKPYITLTELTESLMSSKSTMSVTIESLVQAGLVDRQVSVHNRREVRLSVTEDGRSVSRKSIENANAYRAMSLVLEELEPEEIQTLLKMNQHILAKLEASQIKPK